MLTFPQAAAQFTAHTAFQYKLVSIMFTLVCPLPNVVMN